MFEALRYAQQKLGLGASSDDDLDPEEEEERHVTGQQLCEAIRRYAVQQYGLLSKRVLNHWGIHSTSDFGEIVFNLIEIGQMRKTDTDRREDFDDVFDFDEGLRDAFVPLASDSARNADLEARSLAAIRIGLAAPKLGLVPTLHGDLWLSSCLQVGRRHRSHRFTSRIGDEPRACLARRDRGGHPAGRSQSGRRGRWSTRPGLPRSGAGSRRFVQQRGIARRHRGGGHRHVAPGSVHERSDRGPRLEFLEGFVREDGGIYSKDSLHKNYETSVAIVCFSEANGDGHYDEILRNAEHFVKTLQWDEDEGLTKDDMNYGGAATATASGPTCRTPAF